MTEHEASTAMNAVRTLHAHELQYLVQCARLRELLMVKGPWMLALVVTDITLLALGVFNMMRWREGGSDWNLYGACLLSVEAAWLSWLAAGVLSHWLVALYLLRCTARLIADRRRAFKNEGWL